MATSWKELNFAVDFVDEICEEISEAVLPTEKIDLSLLVKK